MRVPREAPLPKRSAKRFAVESVELVGRGVRTIGPEHPLWREWRSAEVVAHGALLRLRPPPEVTDDVVEEVARRLRDAGAARVVVLPRKRSIVIATAPAASVARARDVVLELCAQARVEDGAALRGLCEQVMDAEGL